MKGRAVTTEEFERMLDTLPKVAPEHAVASWRFLLRGLWLSGLRLDDACQLYWSGPRGHLVDLSGDYPMLQIRGELEKGGVDRLLAIALEFGEFLESVPEEARHGRVFRPLPNTPGAGTPQRHRVGMIISRIGKTAGVVVDHSPRTGEARKFASAHDLRRSFGDRWSRKVVPAVLMELMRHASIATTMDYYVERNADATVAVLWGIHAAEAASAPAKPVRQRAAK